MITWHYITRAAYDAAKVGDKTEDKLFYLSDTHEIYRGTQSFSESVILYTTTKPATPAVGKLYIESTTLEGWIYTGSAWTQVIQAVQSTVDAADTTKPVSGKAVADYVSGQIGTLSTDAVTDVTYEAATNKITVTWVDDNKDPVVTELSNVASDLSYDADTGLLKVKNAQGTAIGTGINLDLERFVSKASYDAKTKKITLSFNRGDPLTIDVADLVDTYTAGADTSTIHVDITDNAITASVKVSAEAGNQIVTKADGLYVAATDISGKVDKVSGATAKNVATLTAEGGIQDSNYTLGVATLATTPNATTLATEAAVNAIKTTLEGTLATKMAKVGSGHENEIITADATGDAKASGVKAGGASFKATTDSTTLATEKGVETYVTGYAVAKTSVVASISGSSTENVASEKAVADAITWKTTV